MIYLVLITILLLFFLFALVISKAVKKITGYKLCAICSACSTTWISLLVLRQLNLVEVENSLIAVLAGGSVVGIMFELQEYFKKNNIKRFWIVRLMVIIIGFHLAYALAIWKVSMILIGLLGVLISFGIIIMFKRTNNKKTHAKASSKSQVADNQEISEQEKQDAIKKLEKSLEDCC